MGTGLLTIDVVALLLDARGYTGTLTLGRSDFWLDLRACTFEHRRAYSVGMLLDAVQYLVVLQNHKLVVMSGSQHSARTEADLLVRLD
jgi:hypothetical protein